MAISIYSLEKLLEYAEKVLAAQENGKGIVYEKICLCYFSGGIFNGGGGVLLRHLSLY